MSSPRKRASNDSGTTVALPFLDRNDEERRAVAMEHRTTKGRGAGKNGTRTGAAGADRWILAVGKRVDRRWLVEMSLGRQRRISHRGAEAAHAA
jgi:hypothetical protein